MDCLWNRGNRKQSEYKDFLPNMTREPSEFDQSVIREKVQVIANHQSVIRDAPAAIRD